MNYIQCFGGIGANVVDVSLEFVRANTTAFQTYVELDRKAHAAFRPGDVHDGKGGFSTPAIGAKREQAHAVLVDYRLSQRRAILEEELRDRDLMSDLERSAARVRVTELHDEIDQQCERAAKAIDSAATHHDLPDEVRAAVRGYGDDWSLPD